MSESIEIRFEGSWDKAQVLPDGSRVLFGATITSPRKWAGQVRDLIMWRDGSVHLGRDQSLSFSQPVGGDGE